MFGFFCKPYDCYQYIDYNKVNVYLAGPINKGESNWRSKLKSTSRCNYVNPENWNINNCSNIVENDIEAIKKCDIVFAYCPFLSAGTSMEFVYAHKYNKPVILVIPKRFISPWHEYHVLGKPNSAIVNNIKVGKKLLDKFVGECYEN